MSFDGPALLQRLSDLQSVAPEPRRFVVAFSGGLDSSVLLHALAGDRARHGCEILAVYVDHGLQRDAAEWGDHCRTFAASLDVDFVEKKVVVDLDSGKGIEAAARQARYGALCTVLQTGDWLLSAHHEDDQAETVLYNLMRGSGSSGLAGIPGARRLAKGWLLRPLLDVPRDDLQAYAGEHGIDFISDPTNLATEPDRNYLRHEVLPRLEARWPGAAGRIRRSAALAREAADLLAALAEIDREQFADRSDRLSVPELVQLSPARQRNLLRYLILELGMPSPGARHLDQIISELIPARGDAQPLVAWPGARVRRYRDRLYLLPAADPDDLDPPAQEIADERTLLPGDLGILELCPGAKTGLSDAVIDAGIELRTRVGGEEIKLPNQKHTKKLKKLLQEEGVVPWMRERLPLLYSDGRLVAVADLWIAAHAESRPGTGISWQNRPPLH